MQWFSLVILQANPSLQVPFTKNQYSSSEGIPSMQSAECQIILLCGLRNFSGMPHHLHRISLSSPTPAPIPCCIVYLVFYYLDYTFHISVWLFYFIFLYFSPLLESQHFQGPCPSPHQSHFPVVLCIWYSIILIILFIYLFAFVFHIILYFSPLLDLQHFQSPCPPLLQPHSPVV